MTLARLLAAALLLCSLPAFTQDQQPLKQGVMARGTGFFALSFDTAATPSEPWRIIPSRPEDFSSGQNALAPMRLDQYRLDQIKGDPHIRYFKLDALDADTTCYAIRSYVVARDSKDSDSTHPTGYSTCRPAARYHLKTTEFRSSSVDR
jgi:hypothetical protein